MKKAVLLLLSFMLLLSSCSAVTPTSSTSDTPSDATHSADGGREESALSDAAPSDKPADGVSAPSLNDSPAPSKEPEPDVSPVPSPSKEPDVSLDPTPTPTPTPTPSPSDDDDIAPPSPFDQTPPQPIGFENIDAALGFAASPDLDRYTKDWLAAYRQMTGAFQKDGYITYVSHADAQRYNEKVTLFPQVTYEDLGAGYWFVFEEKMYQVIVYTVKDGEDYRMEAGDGAMLAYYTKRMGNTPANTETVSSKQEQLDEVLFIKYENWAVAYAFLDETHYIKVRRPDKESTVSQFVTFIEGLSFEQRLLEKAE
ncbi:MAG: hypothetical protein IJZ37_04935 [Clostridia bacterium]|nr:hypothetical protein [Clostridia bacterium]